MCVLASDNSEHVERLATFSGTCRERLIDFLRWLYLNDATRMPNGSVRMRSPLTVEEIAEFVGATREHVSRMIYQLEEEAVVHRCNGWYVVPSESPLKIEDKS